MDAHFRNEKVKKVKGLCCFLLLLMVNFCDASRMSSTASQTLEIKKYLSRVNKPPVKSITSPDGDIIDCVLVTQQPAFDHPLLKNHTIQMTPSDLPGRRVSDDNEISRGKKELRNNTKHVTQLWHLNGRCPEGTVPIRRTKEEDLLRASSLESFGKKSYRGRPKLNFTDPFFYSEGHEHALVYVTGSKYFGAKAALNVWNPQVQVPNEFSLSQLWVLGDSAGGASGPDLNSLETGWQIYPEFYGDSQTRLFIYWTNNGYQTGCYNLQCPGFVQTNQEVAIGGTILGTSVYGGDPYEIQLTISKSPQDGNWWLQYGDIVVGYWPSSLFPNLANGASVIEWGGEVVNTKSDGMHTTTQMGSGHFPPEGPGKASYIRGLQVVDNTNRLTDVEKVSIVQEASTCYNTTDLRDGPSGKYFLYGGPGRNPNCP